MVKKYTDKQLLERVKSLESFKGYPEGRWIIGVRSEEDLPNKFDDKFYTYEGTKFIDVVTGTTNPGETILKGGFKKFNKKGAAILKSDEWYHNVWMYGLHRGRMPALRQRGAKVIVYRDGDLDGKSEEMGPQTEGWYGINYHTNTYNLEDKNLEVLKDNIGAWSAGCQVVNERLAYLNQMKWYEKALANGVQKFVTYVLINEF